MRGARGCWSLRAGRSCTPPAARTGKRRRARPRWSCATRSMACVRRWAMVLPVYLDDVVRMRKPHACGGTDWVIVRVGADIGLRCLQCNHRVLLVRSLFERRLQRFLKRAMPPEPEVDLDLEPRSTDG